jgi:hypothetical protein
MAPSATEVEPQQSIPVLPGKAQAASTKTWVKSTGVLDAYEHFEVTPVIGREYPHANLVDWLNAPNSEELLRELALTSEFSHTNIFLPSPLRAYSANDEQ